MENIIGKDVRQYEGVILRNMTVGDDVILGDHVFAVDSVIGNHCTVERRGMVFNSCIGDYSYTGYNAVIKHVQIGRYCSLSWNVSLGGADHDYKSLSTHPFLFNSRYGLCGDARGGTPLSKKDVK